MIRIREAQERDATQVCDVFRATYGEHYTYQKFYDRQEVKKMIFSDETLMFVAEEEETERIQGTASVVIEAGAFSDLVGEFGRLAVRPEARGHKLGSRLMQARLQGVEQRLHVGLSETRVTHPYSTRIGLQHGFAPLGFLPMKLQLEWRESAALMIRHFGSALALRRNNPRVIPEVYPFACLSMSNCGLSCDAIVDDEVASYPYDDAFDLSEMTLDGYTSLLRIERGRVRNREIFGPARLHYGLFMLQAKQSVYLIARKQGVVAGAIGFTRNDLDHNIRVFELISLDDHVIRFLLDALVQKCQEEWDMAYIEIDVSAHAPRMQRTLLELGFVPAAYVPALTFHHVERLDLVKMVRLLVPLDLGPLELLPPIQEVADLVLHALASRTVIPRIEQAMDQIHLFRGLDDEQSRRLASLCDVATFDAGAPIFDEGTPSEAMYILLEGQAEVTMAGAQLPEVTVAAGECLGEMSLLTGTPHSAAARAAGRVEAAVLPHDDLRSLIRRRPGIGVVLYRNLASELSRKLKQSDRLLLRYAP